MCDVVEVVDAVILYDVSFFVFSSREWFLDDGTDGMPILGADLVFTYLVFSIYYLIFIIYYSYR